jgi:hypothetical protein
MKALILAGLLLSQLSFAATKYEKCEWVANIAYATAVRHNQGVDAANLREATIAILPQYERYLVEENLVKFDRFASVISSEDRDISPAMVRRVYMDTCLKTER